MKASRRAYGLASDPYFAMPLQASANIANNARTGPRRRRTKQYTASAAAVNARIDGSLTANDVSPSRRNETLANRWYRGGLPSAGIARNIWSRSGTRETKKVNSSSNQSGLKEFQACTNAHPAAAADTKSASYRVISAAVHEPSAASALAVRNRHEPAPTSGAWARTWSGSGTFADSKVMGRPSEPVTV